MTQGQPPKGGLEFLVHAGLVTEAEAEIKMTPEIKSELESHLQGCDFCSRFYGLYNVVIEKRENPLNLNSSGSMTTH
jgi:hypothetical protein